MKYLDDFFVNFEAVKILMMLWLNRKDKQVKYQTSCITDETRIEKNIFDWKNYCNIETNHERMICQKEPDFIRNLVPFYS